MFRVAYRALFVSMVGSVLGLWLLPNMLMAAFGYEWFWFSCFVVLGLVLLVLEWFVFAFLVCGVDGSDTGFNVRSSLITVGFCLVVVAAFSGVAGLLAALVGPSFASRFGIYQARLLVASIIFVAGLGISAVLCWWLVRGFIGSRPWSQWLPRWGTFWRLGMLALAAGGVGAFSSWVIGRSHGLVVVASVIVTVLCGAVAVMFAVGIVINGSTDINWPVFPTTVVIAMMLCGLLVLSVSPVGAAASPLPVGQPENYGKPAQFPQFPQFPQSRSMSNVLPATRVRNNPSQRDPQVGYEDQKPVGELIAVGEGSAVYRTGTRSFSTVLGGVQSTYVDDAGKPQVVDNTLIPGSDAQGDFFANRANDFSARIPVKMDSTHGLHFERDGFAIEIIPQEGDFSRPVTKGNAVMFNDIFPGIDVQYTLIGKIVKEDIIVNRHLVVPKFVTNVVTSGGRLEKAASGALVVRASQDSGDIKAGDIAFQISAPGMFDASGAFSDSLEFDVVISDVTAIATIIAPQRWLDDPKRAYPVRIDPTVDIAPSAVSMVGVEQGSADTQIGDNGYPYVGYDDGIVSGNLAQYGNMHAISRSYVGVNYDFTQLMREARIDSAQLQLHHYTAWSHGVTQFGLYTVGDAWSTNAVSWNNQPSSDSHTFVGLANASTNPGYISWDLRETVNNWVQGLIPQHGLVVKATDERNMQAEVFSNKNSGAPPRLVINWTVPDPVDPNYPLSNVSINLRTITEKDAAGKQIFDGVFADGVATPDAEVSYVLNPVNVTDKTQASRSYKFPNSSGFESIFPSGTRYSDKLSNWQTGPAVSLTNDTTYKYVATATKDGATSPAVSSDRFLIYEVKKRDTLPFIANYYGVTLGQLMADNKVQDTLAMERNTLFIRNPNTIVPYNPPPLTDEQKKQIDSNLMGRGLHCEYGFEPINLNTGNFWLEVQDAAIEDQRGNLSITRSYNSLGQQSRSMFGFGWEFEYSQTLTRAIDGSLIYTTADGKMLTLMRQGAEYFGPEGLNITAVEVPVTTGDITILTFDLKTNDGKVLHFNGWGLLESVRTRSGNLTQLGYNSSMSLISIAGPSGVGFALTYTASGQVETVTRPDGVVLRYSYDSAGNLTSFIDGNGNTISYAYDAEHNMVSWTDQNGAMVVKNTFDGLGRVTSQADAKGQMANLVYEQGKTVTIDAIGNKTTYLTDDAHRTVGIIYPDGYQINRSYGSGNTLSSDEFGSYTYTAAGDRETVTDLAGGVTRYSYNANHQLTSITDPDNYVTTSTYDERSNLASTTKPGGGKTSYVWDEDNRLTSLANELGGITTFTYDGKVGIPSSQTSSKESFSFSYNAMGQVISKTNAIGQVERYSYDAEGQLLSEQVSDGGVTSYGRDKVGLVSSLTDPNGFMTKFNYDAMRNMVQVITPDGDKTVFNYDANNRKTSVTNPLGATTVFTYDDRGHMLSAQDPRNGKSGFEYSQQGLLLSETAADGGVTRYTYDAVGRRLSKTNPVGSKITLTYSAAGRIASSTDGNQNTNTMTYGSDGLLAKVMAPEEKVTTFTYDAAGNMIGSDINGHATTMIFDAAGVLVATKNPAGNTEKYSYDPAGQLVATTDVTGATTQYSYDPAGRVTSITDPTGSVSIYGYDLAGNLVTKTDAKGNVITYVYDRLNHLIGVKDPIGAVTTYQYDSAEKLISQTDPYGAKTTYTYDLAGSLLSSTNGLGHTTTFTYDPVGRVTSLTDPLGAITQYSYDLAGNSVGLVNPNGRTTTVTHDGAGNPVKAVTSDGRTETSSYDRLGRLVDQVDAEGRHQTTTYDVWGNTTKVTSFDQVTVDYAFDKTGYVVAATNPKSGTVNFARDKAGRLLSQTDPLGGVASYTYDAAGRQLSHIDQVGGVELFGYDPNGNLISLTDPLGRVTTYSYDAMDRVVSSVDPNEHATLYTRDGLGNTTSVTRPAGDITGYGYDLVGNLTAVKLANGGVDAFEYDAVGQVVKKIDPLGAATSYEWDAMGWLASQTDAVGAKESYAYSLSGALESRTQANGGVFSYSYDKLDRLSQLKTPLGRVKNFNYDQAGNLVAESDSLGRKNTYAWDEVRQLVSATNARGGSTKFVYDANGRLTSQTDALGATTSYGFDAVGQITRITRPDATSDMFSYDLAGQLTAKTPSGLGTTTYGYDKAGNLATVTNPVGAATVTSYDANDRPITVTDSLGATQNYEWTVTDQVAAITSADKATTKFTYDKARNRTSTTNPLGLVTKYNYDKLGQLTQASDPMGSVLSHTYDLMGNLTSSKDPNGNLTSYEYDVEGNQTSMTTPTGEVARWTYDPAGRLTKTIKPGGARVSYDYDTLDDLVSKQFAGISAEDVSASFDVLGQRILMTDPSGTSHYIYDELGRLSSVTNGNDKTVLYRYDANGQVGQITYPDGSQVSYGYDLVGNLATVTDAVGVSRYSYDSNNRVVSLARPDGTITNYSYDPMGRVIGLTNIAADGVAISKYVYEFDSAGQIIREIETLPSPTPGSKPITVTRDLNYDNAGRLSGYREQNDLIMLLLRSAGSDTVTYTYDANGNKTSTVEVDAHGVQLDRTVFTYDASNKLTHTDSTTTGVTTYSYNESGALISAANPSGLKTYEYSAAERLKAVRDGGRLLMAASYDGDDNRVFQVSMRDVNYQVQESEEVIEQTAKDSEKPNISVKGSGIPSSASESGKDVFWSAASWFGYGAIQAGAQLTANGNAVLAAATAGMLARLWSLLPDQSKGLDSKDMKSLQTSGVDSAELPSIGAVPTAGVTIPGAISQAQGITYDVMHYVNDVNRSHTQVLAEYGNDDRLRATYTYGDQRLSVHAQIDDPTKSWLTTTGNSGSSDSVMGWYIPDGRGSVGQVVAGGEIAQSATYSPAGVASIFKGSTQSSIFGFNAEELNPVTGQQFLRARYLDTELSRFTQADTVLGSVEDAQSTNRYTYAFNDPVSHIDPSGMWPSWVDKAKEKVNGVANWVNSHVVKPVVYTGQKVASYVHQHVITPIANKINNYCKWVTPLVTMAYYSANSVMEQVIEVSGDGFAKYLDLQLGSSSQRTRMIKYVTNKIKARICSVSPYGGREKIKNLPATEPRVDNPKREPLGWPPNNLSVAKKIYDPENWGKSNAYLSTLDFITARANEDASQLDEMRRNNFVNIPKTVFDFKKLMSSKNYGDYKVDLGYMLSRGAGQLADYSESYKWMDLPRSNRKVYYDIWANISYGYSGSSALISPELLIKASTSSVSGVGVTDEGDVLTVKMGIELYRNHPDGFTAADLDGIVRKYEKELFVLDKIKDK
ncbi:MAG: DNRLRE domain-containing protein [Propionibacteriaceae bacterium]